MKISRGRTKGEGRGSVGIVIAAVHMHSMYMYMCTGVYSTCKYRQRRREECRMAVMGFWWLCVWGGEDVTIRGEVVEREGWR